MEQPSDGKKHPLIVAAENGKRIVAGVLLVLMFIVLAIAVFELIWLMVVTIIPGLSSDAVKLVMTEAQLLSIFGVFLSVLIAMELIETVEVYFRDHEVHAEIVLLVALIAMARKVVLLDLHEYEPMMVFALATLFIGLAAAYVAIRWTKALGPAETGGE